MQIDNKYSKVITSYPSKEPLVISEKVELILSDYEKLCSWIIDSLIGYFTSSELDFIRFATQGVTFTIDMNPLYKLVFMLDYSLKSSPYDKEKPANIIRKVQDLKPEQCYILLLLCADSFYGAGERINILYPGTKKE